jgi:hypothetical protein
LGASDSKHEKVVPAIRREFRHGGLWWWRGGGATLINMAAQRLVWLRAAVTPQMNYFALH